MFWHIRRFFLSIPSAIRALRFRVQWGFSQRDIWAIDDALAQWIAPRLYYFAENHCSHPYEVDDDVWTAILYKMADGFDLMAKEEWDTEDTFAYCEECLDLFREFYFYLWD